MASARRRVDLTPPDRPVPGSTQQMRSRREAAEPPGLPMESDGAALSRDGRGAPPATVVGRADPAAGAATGLPFGPGSLDSPLLTYDTAFRERSDLATTGSQVAQVST